MRKEIKICLPPYKLLYAVLFAILLSLVRGVSDVSEIGIALDPNIALLSVIFCADTCEMEFRGKRWELFRLYSIKKRKKIILLRMAVQTAALCIIAYVGYGFFYWQKPLNRLDLSQTALFAVYMGAVTVTVLFWGMLSLTLVNLFRNLWGGIGLSVLLWLLVNSKAGDAALGSFNVFAYSFRAAENTGDFSWVLGKAAALAITAALVLLSGVILKKRG